jgi:Cof subfamily protein (haloacid dehalogenase superfamily)
MAILHLFVTDLDGTLLRSNAVLSEYALATLTDLLEKGMLFTIASARSLPSIQAILRGLPLTLPIIELNGALVSDFASGKHKSVHALDRTMSERVLGLLRERGLAPFVAIAMDGQTRLYHGPLNNSAMQWYRDEKVEKGDQGLVRVDDLECAPHEATLGFTLLDRHEVLEQVVREIDRACAGRVKQYLFEHPYCHGFSELSIQDVGASKAAPIAALQDLLGATGPAALTVFGDNVNDIEMFKLAGRSVAPSNAVPAVRRIATHIVASNDDDGIVRWLHALMNEAAGS